MIPWNTVKVELSIILASQELTVPKITLVGLSWANFQFFPFLLRLVFCKVKELLFTSIKMLNFLFAIRFSFLLVECGTQDSFTIIGGISVQGLFSY
jgi:hypothetical protein